jgi:hypothetical protein
MVAVLEVALGVLSSASKYSDTALLAAFAAEREAFDFLQS